ncbi:MAG: hypothetical protein MJ232_03095 [archaeon]|nr:hypothetical protein [archaeon]
MFFTESFKFLDLTVPGTFVTFKEFFLFLIVVFFGIKLFHKYIGFSSNDENSSDSVRKEAK